MMNLSDWSFVQTNTQADEVILFTADPVRVEIYPFDIVDGIKAETPVYKEVLYPESGTVSLIGFNDVFSLILGTKKEAFFVAEVYSEKGVNPVQSVTGSVIRSNAHIHNRFDFFRKHFLSAQFIPREIVLSKISASVYVVEHNSPQLIIEVYRIGAWGETTKEVVPFDNMQEKRRSDFSIDLTAMPNPDDIVAVSLICGERRLDYIISKLPPTLTIEYLDTFGNRQTVPIWVGLSSKGEYERDNKLIRGKKLSEVKSYTLTYEAQLAFTTCYESKEMVEEILNSKELFLLDVNGNKVPILITDQKQEFNHSNFDMNSPSFSFCLNRSQSRELIWSRSERALHL